MWIRLALLIGLAALAWLAASSHSGVAASKGAGKKYTLCKSGCAFTDLNQAIASAPAGSVITVGPGTYSSCGVVKKPLRIVGRKDGTGARPRFEGGVCWDKGTFVLRAPNIIVEGVEISNVSAPSQNGACFRIDPPAENVTIRDVYCHDSENGVLGGPKRGSILIEDSVFERNGAGGRAHGIYINRADSLVVRRSRILSTKGQGHSLKSGARSLLIEDSVIAALDGDNSRAVDAYAGGKLVIRRSVIQQGENSSNHDAVAIALEPKRRHPGSHSALIEDNWIIFDDLTRCCRWVLNSKQSAPVKVRGNRIVGMTKMTAPKSNAAEGENVEFENRAAANLPAYDHTPASLPEPGAP